MNGSDSDQAPHSSPNSGSVRPAGRPSSSDRSALTPRQVKPLTDLGELVDRYALSADGTRQLQRVLDLQSRDDAASTTVRDPDLALSRHVADSWVALELECVAAAREIADLGSGAGWPGIALAIALPDAHVRLVESAVRHCRYLQRAVEVADLQNATVVHARAEEWRDGLEGHDLVTARALARLSIVLEYAAPLLRVRGHVVAWKGRLSDDELADGMAAAAHLGLTHVETRDVSASLDADDRVLVVYRKQLTTPSRFPRRAGMATKRPIRAMPSV